MVVPCSSAATQQTLLSEGNPKGWCPFSRISALLVAHLARLNHAPRALNFTKTDISGGTNKFETASNNMTPKLHRQFLKTAGEFAPELRTHMQRLGPVQIPNRKPLGLPKFLARVIIGQQLSTKAARTIWSRIQTAARDADQRIPHFFCEANVDAIRACGASGNKAKALLAINEAYADGRISAARLRKMDFDTRSATLRDLHGVGQWTVDMASMFYFGDTDIWPDGDLAVRAHIPQLSQCQTITQNG